MKRKKRRKRKSVKTQKRRRKRRKGRIAKSWRKKVKSGEKKIIKKRKRK